MSVERWEPFREALSLRDSFNRQFDEALVRPASTLKRTSAYGGHRTVTGANPPTTPGELPPSCTS